MSQLNGHPLSKVSTRAECIVRLTAELLFKKELPALFCQACRHRLDAPTFRRDLRLHTGIGRIREDFWPHFLPADGRLARKWLVSLGTG